jgi:hypothetical protein
MHRPRRLAVVAVAASSLIVPATAAFANNSAASLPKLTLTVSPPDPATGAPTASADWVGNPHTNQVLQVTTGDNPNADGALSYFDGVVTNTPVNGEALGSVNNIAFDYNGPLGAGAPRISLGLSDGSFVYLAAGYSSQSQGDGWYQFNTDDRCGTQVNQLNGGPATIYDSEGGVFTSDPGGEDAWVKMALAHGVDTTITSIDVVQDENHGTVDFDNLRFDTVQFEQGGVKGAFENVAPVGAANCGS